MGDAGCVWMSSVEDDGGDTTAVGAGVDVSSLVLVDFFVSGGFIFSSLEIDLTDEEGASFVSVSLILDEGAEAGGAFSFWVVDDLASSGFSPLMIDVAEDVFAVSPGDFVSGIISLEAVFEAVSGGGGGLTSMPTGRP